MVISRKLICMVIMIVIFLVLSTEMSSAQLLENELALKETIKDEYNGNILKHRNTLLRFQAENNLSVDAIIGEQTNEALNKKNKRIIDEIPKEIAEKEWFIIINKTKKILTVYNNGEIYKKYPVALGKAGSPTPNYKFTIINKIINPYWGGMSGKFTPIKGGEPNNPLGKRWLGLSTEKYRGYGIHGNASPFSIGQYISAGCIRMINEDIEELFEYISTKTDVWIGTEEVLEEWGVKQYIEYRKEEKVCSIEWKKTRWHLLLHLTTLF